MGDDYEFDVDDYVKKYLRGNLDAQRALYLRHFLPKYSEDQIEDMVNDLYEEFHEIEAYANAKYMGITYGYNWVDVEPETQSD